MGSQAAYLPVSPMESSDENEEDSIARTVDVRRVPKSVGRKSLASRKNREHYRPERAAQPLFRHGKAWVYATASFMPQLVSSGCIMPEPSLRMMHVVLQPHTYATGRFSR
jgi:hypothetical protein